MQSPGSPCEISDAGDSMDYFFELPESTDSDTDDDHGQSDGFNPEVPQYKGETHTKSAPRRNRTATLVKSRCVSTMRHEPSLIDWFMRWLGQIPRQNELLALRQGLFHDILPKITRNQRRHKSKNLEVFEVYKHAIFRKLCDGKSFTEFLIVLLQARNSFQKKQILMHIYGVDKL